MKLSRTTPISLIAALSITLPALAIDPPPGFTSQEVPSNLSQPAKIVFAADGRMFVAEKKGIVRVFVNGVQQSTPFIDLQAEIGNGGYRGLLGMALDPNFLTNRHVYLAYVVDPIFGAPDEPNDVPSLGRVTRYTGTPGSNGNVADPASRTVLIGAIPNQGVCLCQKHAITTVVFGLDGSLLVGAGDGAHDDLYDAGGEDPECFQSPWYSVDQDLGSFRSQYIGSLAGKMLRIDPNTGAGLPSNPYWNGNAQANQSKVWLYGLRMPFRFCVRPPAPGSGTQPPGPGTLYIGDVGGDEYEELNVAAIGGGNYGWPCREGPDPAPVYPSLTPATHGCGTIGSPSNPGPLIEPLFSWDRNHPDISVPPGYTGRTGLGGFFYSGSSFPIAYHGAYFFGDFNDGWINVIKVDEDNQLINAFNFAPENKDGPVDFVMHPITGELYYLLFWQGEVHRISYVGPGDGDITGDGVVNVDDLLQVITRWGPCIGGPQNCPSDINGDGEGNVDDLLLVINNWG